MTDIIINDSSPTKAGIIGISSVSFNLLDHKVYAAQKIQSMCGFFVSQVVDGTSDLITWQEAIFDATKPQGTDVSIYVRSALTTDSLSTAEWNGPYFNTTTDISDLKGRYLQFMVTLCSDGTKNWSYGYSSATPVFRSISLTYASSSNASIFYSTAFNLGFVPKHVLLTYNGDVTSDSIVRFAISGFDSVDSNDYQYIDPNKIEELDELSILSTKIKLMIEMVGDAGVPVTIHEVALMFSGDQQLVLNDMSTSSTSSSSSSSIDSSSSSSSSSIDSSSSSSSSSSP